jgi:outer membrane protein OmpA-like peptidoglycan-associated protein
VAGSRTEIDDPGLDTTPTTFFQDSPVTMSAPATSTSTSTSTGPSGDAQVTERARTEPMGRLDEADAAYEAKAYAPALALYRQAAAQPGADRMRGLVGAYLAASRLGSDAQAQAVFADIVAHGLQTRMLGVKLLFTPGKTEFWPDEAISKPYAGWLQEIARQAGAGTGCLQVVGHSSRSGSEAFNLTLSEQRADAIRTRLESGNAGLVRRVSIAGVGWRENLVGTGSDDLRDAVDRRVEFKVLACP